ncbi:MAG: crossover junction endodeoxyribonuclease RuvC [Brevinematales bacterium]
MGIDPGLERLGYGVIESVGSGYHVCGYGLVRTDKNCSTPERLKVLYEDVGALVEKYTPDVVVVEELIFSKNVTTAMVVSAARGVVMLLAAQKGLLLLEVSPSRVKRLVCGHGRATKAQMQRAVGYILGLSEIPSPDDVADALALAMVGALYRKVDV